MLRSTLSIALLVAFASTAPAQARAQDNPPTASSTSDDRDVVADILFVCGAWKVPRPEASPALDGEGALRRALEECDAPKDAASYCRVSMPPHDAAGLGLLDDSALRAVLAERCTLAALKDVAVTKADKLGQVIASVSRRERQRCQTRLTTQAAAELAQLPVPALPAWLMSHCGAVAPPPPGLASVASIEAPYIDVTSAVPAQAAFPLEGTNDDWKKSGPHPDTKKLGVYRALGHFFFWTGALEIVAGGLLIGEGDVLAIPFLAEGGLRLLLALGFGAGRQSVKAELGRKAQLSLAPLPGMLRGGPVGLSLHAAF